MYQIAFNYLYSVNSQQIFKRVESSWKETLVGLYQMQYREKEALLNQKFPHADAKMSQVIGFMEWNELVKYPIITSNSFTSQKYKFTMITYEKYDTKEVFNDFNEKNNFTIIIDDNQTVEYEMNVSYQVLDNPIYCSTLDT